MTTNLSAHAACLPVQNEALSLRRVSLFFVMGLYALMGSPTPDHPGWIELLLGLGLIAFVGASGGMRIISPAQPSPPFVNALRALVCYGLVVPTAVGVINGNDTLLAARDMLSFLFLALPLVLSFRDMTSASFRSLILGLACCIAALFSVRTLLPVLNLWIPQGELMYLSNSPLVLFAGVYAIIGAWHAFETRAIVPAFFWMALSALICAAMLLDTQRATLLAMVLSLLMYGLYRFAKRPVNQILPALVLIAVCGAGWVLIYDVFQLMAVKTQAVGWNARQAEAWAVYEALAKNPGAILWGIGWGGSFSSPAVAGLDVNFTHSFLTTLALKGGLLLLGLGLWVLIAGCLSVLRLILSGREADVRIGLALGWAFIIPMFLYASHKSLDYGLVLMVMVLWSRSASMVAKPDPIG